MVAGRSRIADEIALQPAQLIHDVVCLAIDGGDVHRLRRRLGGLAASTAVNTAATAIRASTGVSDAPAPCDPERGHCDQEQKRKNPHRGQLSGGSFRRGLHSESNNCWARKLKKSGPASCWKKSERNSSAEL